MSCSPEHNEINGVVIKHVIQQHQAWLIKSRDDEDVQPIRDEHMCALCQFLRKSFDVEKMLRVQFIGEEAVDTGGPNGNCFFSSLMKCLWLQLFLKGFLAT